MASSSLGRVHLVSRLSLAMVFIYHGLVPKIIWLSSVEVSLANALNIGLPAATVALLAGMLDVSVGLAVLLIPKSVIPVYWAMAMLLALLIDVAYCMPKLLIEAFNPVTLNLLSIAMGYVVISTQPESTG